MLGKILVAIFAILSGALFGLSVGECFRDPVRDLPVNILVAAVWFVIGIFANLVAFIKWSKRHGRRI